MERKRVASQITTQEFENHFEEQIIEYKTNNVLKNHGKEAFYGKIRGNQFFFFFYNAYDIFSWRLFNQMVAPTAMYGKIEEEREGIAIEYYMAKEKKIRNFLVFCVCFLGFITITLLITKQIGLSGILMLILWIYLLFFFKKPKKEIERCEAKLFELLKSN